MRNQILLVVLLFCGCSRLTYKDLVLSDEMKPGQKSPEQLTAKQVEEDSKLLKFILKRAYAGRFVISKEMMAMAYEEIDAIQGDMSTKSYCEQVGQTLSKIPDFHLHVRLNGKVCSRAKKKTKATLGANIAKKQKKTWVVEKRKYRRKNYLLISISRFPSHKSKKWQGFMEAVEKNYRSGMPVILDLRSNGGGDDTFGYRLSGFFHRSKNLNFPTPYEKQIVGQTPETQVLKVNVAKYWLRGDISEKRPLEIYLKEQEQVLEKILTENLPEQKITLNEKIPESWTFKGHKSEIYILTDENCYSSCESTIDSFEYNPYVKKVGKATGGMLHFGNVSPAFLKHSKLYVQVPTHANIYYDRRFIEKKGIQPDLEVEDGQDALRYTLKYLL